MTDDIPSGEPPDKVTFQLYWRDRTTGVRWFVLNDEMRLWPSQRKARRWMRLAYVQADLARLEAFFVAAGAIPEGGRLEIFWRRSRRKADPESLEDLLNI